MDFLLEFATVMKTLVAKIDSDHSSIFVCFMVSLRCTLNLVQFRSLLGSQELCPVVDGGDSWGDASAGGGRQGCVRGPFSCE